MSPLPRHFKWAGPVALFQLKPGGTAFSTKLRHCQGELREFLFCFKHESNCWWRGVIEGNRHSELLMLWIGDNCNSKFQTLFQVSSRQFTRFWNKKWKSKVKTRNIQSHAKSKFNNLAWSYNRHQLATILCETERNKERVKKKWKTLLDRRNALGKI